MSSRMRMAGPRFMLDHVWTRRHLSDYIDDELQEGERARVRHHTHRCPQCRALLKTLQQTVRALAELRPPRRHPELAESVIARLRGS